MTYATTVSATEFKQHFGKYMKLVADQDIKVTRNGSVVGIWTSPYRDKVDIVEELAGSIHGVVDLEADRNERVNSL